MTTAGLLLGTFNIEFPMTRRTLERVPEHLAGWQPHSKSMPMGRLAMHVARIPDLMTLVLTTPGFDAATRQASDLSFRSSQDLLRTFDDSASRMRTLLESATDEDLATPWEFGVNGKIFSAEPRAVTLLHMGLGHLVHHRAQLGTYLRLNNLPVPPVYGPSADERPHLESR